MLLRITAPFAAFRTFTAGAYRPSAAFITPSAAYGLLLNIAAIEMRRDDGLSAMTVTAPRLPRARVAVGALVAPEVATLYQQLHNYPVGESGREHEADTKGNKYNIQPVRREVLVGIDGYIALEGNAALEERVREGLRLGAAYAPEGTRRYGLPFLGDNNFLLSRLEEEWEPTPACWYVKAGPGATMRERPVRLTAWVDRAGMAGTVAPMYVLSEEASAAVPEDAWTAIEPPG